MNKKSVLLLSLALSATLSSAQSITLEEALRQAKANRSSIKAANLQVVEARHLKNSTGAPSPTRVGIGASTPLHFGATDQDLFIEQPLDVFGRTNANRRLGASRVLLAESALQSALLEVQSETLEMFARAEASRETLSVCSKITEITDQLHKLTIRRFEEGKIPKIQVTRAQIELNRATQKESASKSELEAALKGLAGAIGTDKIAEVSGDFALTVPQNLDMKMRPDLMALEAQKAEAAAEASIADRSRLPELSLVGLRNPWEERRGQFGARLQLTWSILDHGKSREEVKAAKAKDKAAEASMEDSRKRAFAELQAIDTEIEAASKQLVGFQELARDFRNLIALAQIAFREGVGTQIEVLEATRSLRELEEEAIASRLRVNLLLTQRLKIAGHTLEAIR